MVGSIVPTAILLAVGTVPGKPMRPHLIRLGLVLWLLTYLPSVWGRGMVRENPTSLRLPEQGLMSEWATEPAFPGLPPVYATAVATPPGHTNLLYCVSKGGLIYAITNLAEPSLTVALDLTQRVNTEAESGALGIAFHPGFETNRWVFLTYCLREVSGGTTNLFNRLSRFTVDPNDLARLDPASEQPLITQVDEDPTHNGGDLEFGPDGYLYVSLGDEGGANNRFGNAWKLDHDFFSGILRIDVDRLSDNLEPNPHPSVHAGTYKIPRDNPFIGLTSYQVGDLLVWPTLDAGSIRTEFFAVGFRNPWRMAFDQTRGELYCNDVGQARREEVSIVVRGGNHGWHLREGTLNWPFAVPQGGLTDPVFEYEHDAGRLAITGALYYRGTVYPELDDSYLFADYTGDIGTVRRDAGGWSARWFARADSVADLALHPRTGESLVLNVFGGEILKLTRKTTAGVRPPGKLSDTGAFESMATLKPATGVIPYDINVPFWSDGAHKRRWFALRDPESHLEFKSSGVWGTPVGGVWIKHFDMEMQPGDPSSVRRLETRFIVRSSDGIYGMTYRWNANGTEAFLVPAEGAEEILAIATPQGIRSQRWRYPSRSECRVCHTAQAGWVLGFSTEQLHRDIDAGNGIGAESQIAALASAGYLDRDRIEGLNRLARLRPATDESWGVEHRVRSYLAANCVQCHQPGAPNNAKWDARFSTPLEQAGILDAIPLNRLESETARIISPGSLDDSVLYRRISEMVAYHMPPLATYLRDESAVALVGRWIREVLPGRQTYARWVERQGLDATTAMGRREADPDGDGRTNGAEYLFESSPTEPKTVGEVQWELQSGALRVRYGRGGNRVIDLQTSSTPEDPSSWRSLEVSGNEYHVGDTEVWSEVLLPLSGASGFFRIHAVER